MKKTKEDISQLIDDTRNKITEFWDTVLEYACYVINHQYGGHVYVYDTDVLNTMIYDIHDDEGTQIKEIKQDNNGNLRLYNCNGEGYQPESLYREFRTMEIFAEYIQSIDKENNVIS